MSTQVRTKPISEIFLEISRIRTKQGRIDALRHNASPLMQYIVQGAYHPNVVWVLPRGVPPFKPTNQPFDADGVLFNKVEELAIFCYGYQPDIDLEKRKKKFIDLLETVNYNDAILLCHVKDKTINYPFLTYNLFREAFPAWLPEIDEKSWIVDKAAGVEKSVPLDPEANE